MSVRSACYVACDGPCGGTPAEVSTGGAKRARRYAAEEGFIRRKLTDGTSVDLCRRCATLDEPVTPTTPNQEQNR